MARTNIIGKQVIIEASLLFLSLFSLSWATFKELNYHKQKGLHDTVSQFTTVMVFRLLISVIAIKQMMLIQQIC